MTLELIETSRLYLRALTLQDADDIYAYANDPRVAYYVTWDPHKSLEDSRCFIRDYAFPKYEKGEHEPYGIVLKQENRVIGTVGCSWCPQEEQNMILNYALAYKYWGNGFMLEAAKAVVAYAFETQKPHLIKAWCISENKASSRIMQKLGMTFEGRLRGRILRHNIHWDIDVYSILREELQ